MIKDFFLNFLVAAHRLLHEKKIQFFYMLSKFKKKEKKEKLKINFF